MVIAHKSNGSIRICPDLRDVNKAIISDQFPYKISEELSQFLCRLYMLL